MKTKSKSMKSKVFHRHFSGLTKKGWVARLGSVFTDEIRLREPGGLKFSFCPITAVYRDLSGDRVSDDKYQLAAIKIGLNRDTATSIARAADDRDTCHSVTRSRLLRAVGL